MNDTLAAQIEALAAHFTRMQDIMRRYVEPTTYMAEFPKDNTLWERELKEPDRVLQTLEGARNSKDRRDAAFIADMIRMMDGPEQRALNLPATVTALRQAGAAPGVVERLMAVLATAEGNSLSVSGQFDCSPADRASAAKELEEIDWAKGFVQSVLALQHGAREDAPVLIEREHDAECGCPEETWEAFGLHLNMHLSAGKPSNAHADAGDAGEWEMSVTAATIDQARAAIFGWARSIFAAPATDVGEKA